MWNKFSEFKAKKISENDYFILILKHYENAKVYNTNGTKLDDIKGTIFTKIMEFINKRRSKN